MREKNYTCKPIRIYGQWLYLPIEELEDFLTARRGANRGSSDSEMAVAVLAVLLEISPPQLILFFLGMGMERCSKRCEYYNWIMIWSTSCY